MHLQRPVLETERLILRLGKVEDITRILHYFSENQAYLEPFEPKRPKNFFTTEFWIAELNARQQDFEHNRSVKLFLFERTEKAPAVGVINLNNIIRGVFQSATLGYSLAASKQGCGYMTEAGRRLVAYAFDTLNLHRIMANYLPNNQCSANVLKRLGFEIEGHAKEYLFIDGQWRDHVLTSLINRNWRFPLNGKSQ